MEKGMNTNKPDANEEIQQDELSVLVVIDRLEIGPVQLEKRRLICPYTVIPSGAWKETLRGVTNRAVGKSAGIRSSARSRGLPPEAAMTMGSGGR